MAVTEQETLKGITEATERLVLPTVDLTLETKKESVYEPGSAAPVVKDVPTGRGWTIEKTEDMFLGVQKISFAGDRGYITQNIKDRVMARAEKIVDEAYLGALNEFENLPHFDQTNELIVVAIIRKKPL